MNDHGRGVARAASQGGRGGGSAADATAAAGTAQPKPKPSLYWAMCMWLSLQSMTFMFTPKTTAIFMFGPAADPPSELQLKVRGVGWRQAMHGAAWCPCLGRSRLHAAPQVRLETASGCAHARMSALKLTSRFREPPASPPLPAAAGGASPDWWHVGRYAHCLCSGEPS